MTERIILCGTDSVPAGEAPYFIGYSDLVDGYRHAYAVEGRGGRRTIKRSRSRAHPADPRCPGCLEEAE